ncbi:mucin-5AC-like [Ascaphus truei]|uniref:mucin-5AC-like n=1 Tax=Ascaphus truei TaxID=8439 RepID=UPI003F5ADD0C
MNGTFRVISENIPCGSSGTTCSKSIKVILDNYQLVLSQGEMHVTKSGNEFEAPFQTRNSGIYLIIEAKNGLILMWDKKTSIIIKLTEYFQDKVCGLCGNYDGNANNDFNTRGHCLVEDVIEFGNSWKLSPNCPEITFVKDPCEVNPSRKPWAQRQCSIITSQTFQPCHSQVDPQKYYETCVKDACACDMGGDCDCFCTVVAIYAQACSEACACIDWRTPTICPVFCDYYNKDEQCEWHYKPCGANCMKTCRNPGGICLHELSKLEGCYPNCPEETPFFEEVGMNCVAQCGCYDQLGKYHRPGDTVNSCNNCETCNCTMRGIECTYDVKACYCDYNVHIYAYNEIIYQTYDGQGHCLTATCGVNGTIIKTINPCTTPHPQTTLKVSIPVKTTKVSRTTYCVSEKCAWSPWYDVSTPRKDKDGGDFETFYKIREKGYAVCEAPRDIRCRSKKYLGTPSEMGQIAICDISTGLVCLNKKQLKRFCYNYEIQFMCCEPVPCIEPTRVPTTTKPMPSGSSLFTASPSPSQTSAVTSQATSIKPFTVTQTISVSTPSVTYMTGKASSMITAPSTWSTATHITSEGSTTKCFCYVNGNSFSPGEVIYTKRGDDGCLVATICGKSCNIVIQKLPCETTAASATSVRTATATYTGTVTLPASSPSARITSPRSAQTWSPTVTYVSRSTSQATPGETTGPRTVSVSTTFPTKPCFCYVNGTYFSPGKFQTLKSAVICGEPLMP